MSLPTRHQCDRHFRQVDTQLWSRLLSLTRDLDSDTDSTTIFEKSRMALNGEIATSHTLIVASLVTVRGNRSLQAEI